MNTVVRRLAAILAADIVGYSRIMQLDEEETLARIKLYFDGLVRPKVAEHRGRVVKTTGDGVLAEFGSVIDAFACAIEIQQRADAGNQGVPKDRHIEFRIGINVSEIMIDEENDDVFGDGVNIAARLEGQAEPGGICISARAYEDLRQFKVKFEDMGDVRLKNIAQPMRVYALSKNAVRSGKARMSRRTRRNMIRLLIAAGSILILVAGGVFAWRTYSASPEKFVTETIDTLPCSWLRVAEHSETDGQHVFSLAGASVYSAGVRDVIMRAAAAKGIAIQRIETSEVAPLLQQQCGWIEQVRAYRYSGVPRMTVGGWRPGFEGLDFDVSIEAQRLKTEFEVYGISDDGAVAAVADKAQIMAGPGGSGAGVKLIPLNATHVGWSGLMLVEADKPMPVEQLTHTLDPAALADIAKRDNLRFELLWFNVPDRNAIGR
jgi:class 3 adenylate cyclase